MLQNVIGRVVYNPLYFNYLTAERTLSYTSSNFYYFYRINPSQRLGRH
jgi:hypothetical protein